MSVFSFIRCSLNLHAPQRRRVEWNGRAYVGECRHCDAPIERRGRRNWRKRKQSTGEPTGEQRDTPSPT